MRKLCEESVSLFHLIKYILFYRYFDILRKEKTQNEKGEWRRLRTEERGDLQIRISIEWCITRCHSNRESWLRRIHDRLRANSNKKEQLQLTNIAKNIYRLNLFFTFDKPILFMDINKQFTSKRNLISVHWMSALKWNCSFKQKKTSYIFDGLSFFRFLQKSEWNFCTVFSLKIKQKNFIEWHRFSFVFAWSQNRSHFTYNFFCRLQLNLIQMYRHFTWKQFHNSFEFQIPNQILIKCAWLHLCNLTSVCIECYAWRI